MKNKVIGLCPLARQELLRKVGQWPSLGLMAAGVLTLAGGFATGLTSHNAVLLAGFALIAIGAACYLAALRRQ